MFTRVCKAETIPEGGWRLVIADSHLIVLAWPEDGALTALQGVCPHSGMPLNEAEFDGRILTCPNHFWTWDVASGAPLEPKESALAVYPVRVEDGIVFIDTDGVAPLFAAR